MPGELSARMWQLNSYSTSFQHTPAMKSVRNQSSSAAFLGVGCVQSSFLGVPYSISASELQQIRFCVECGNFGEACLLTNSLRATIIMKLEPWIALDAFLYIQRRGKGTAMTALQEANAKRAMQCCCERSPHSRHLTMIREANSHPLHTAEPKHPDFPSLRKSNSYWCHD